MAAATSLLLRIEGLTSLSGNWKAVEEGDVDVVDWVVDVDDERGLNGLNDDKLRDRWRECDGGGESEVSFIDDDSGGVGKRGSGMFISVYNGSSSCTW